jgi:protein-disulfide isomerase
MNENEFQNDALLPSDEQILDGVRRRLSGVEPLVPLPKVWQPDRVRRNVRFRPAGAFGFGGVVAVFLVTVVIGMSLAHQGPFYGAGSGPGASVPRVTTSPTAVLGSVVTPSARIPSDIPSNGRTLGNSSAPVTMDVWIDFRCSACSNFASGTARQLIDKYVAPGKVKIVYHDFLVIDLQDKTHASEDAANAAQCAADQGKYWVYTDWLWANQDPQEAAGAVSRDRLIEMARQAGLDVAAFQACYDAGNHRAAIRGESASASGLLVQGTPTILVNGQPVGGMGTVPDFQTTSAAIDAALATPSASASS